MRNKIPLFIILTIVFAIIGIGLHFFYFKIKASDVIFVNSFHSPKLDSFFYIITQSAESIFLPAVIILLSIFYKKELWHIGVSQVLIIIVVNIIKTIVKSKRPIEYLKDNINIHLLQGLYINKLYSFPSGHTAAAFTLACSLALVFPKYKWLHIILFIWAALVGISRMYLVQHFLIDISFGAIFGTGISFIIFTFFQHFKVFKNGIKRIKK